jgi:hypothetical protein
MRLGRSVVFAIVVFLITLIPGFLLGVVLHMDLARISYSPEPIYVAFRTMLSVGMIINVTIAYLVFLRPLQEYLWAQVIGMALAVELMRYVLSRSLGYTTDESFTWIGLVKGVACGVLATAITLAARKRAATRSSGQLAS